MGLGVTLHGQLALAATENPSERRKIQLHIGLVPYKVGVK